MHLCQLSSARSSGRLQQKASADAPVDEICSAWKANSTNLDGSFSAVRKLLLMQVDDHDTTIRQEGTVQCQVMRRLG